ncbi:DoxX family protein [Haladaptatus sp. CMSO5]|uniref:DoxX family protein n=1 Tax=Haladaptatus sp. CMSO5 TaxID=3120514 RepID=UPI002FCE5A9F
MRTRFTELAPLPIRAVVVGILTIPAMSKFLNFSQSAGFFASLGFPVPEALVVVVGLIEVTAVIMIAFGIAGRVAALSLIPVMMVAMATAGPSWKNAVVLLGAMALFVFGTGAYSVYRLGELPGSPSAQPLSRGRTDSGR